LKTEKNGLCCKFLKFKFKYGEFQGEIREQGEGDQHGGVIWESWTKNAGGLNKVGAL